jgi:hypothetical protein
MNYEFEQLKNRKFMARRGRNGRVFYKSMTKTIFDYESSDEEEKVGKKRTFAQAQGIDGYLNQQSKHLLDIEKHCRNKRLKKNIYKLDYLKLIQQPGPSREAGGYNPGLTNASSDYDKLPRVMNDPVIDSLLRKSNPLIDDVMNHEGLKMINEKGLHPENVFESDFSKN